uniref:Uncharacterized protein n=1 Tax=Anguilla anguilla TaxID=7936 RepID=A0A0E9WNI4_ANGAN
MPLEVFQELLKAVVQPVHGPVAVTHPASTGVEQGGLAQVGEEPGELLRVLLLQLVQEVLQELQARLSAALRPCGLAARLGLAVVRQNVLFHV